jgi:hypothetical protein
VLEDPAANKQTVQATDRPPLGDDSAPQCRIYYVLCEVRVSASLTGNVDVHVFGMAKPEDTSVTVSKLLAYEWKAIDETGLASKLYIFSAKMLCLSGHNASHSYIACTARLENDSNILQIGSELTFPRALEKEPHDEHL